MIYKNDKLNLSFGEMRSALRGNGLPENIVSWTPDDVQRARGVLHEAQKTKMEKMGMRV